jgi:hypothetical protein
MLLLFNELLIQEYKILWEITTTKLVIQSKSWSEMGLLVHISKLVMWDVEKLE